MDLSVVIVNWNTCGLLRDCLASLPAATAGLAVEILVVDNASQDGTAAMIGREFPHVRLLEAGGNLGFARANNLALPRTAGDMVLLLNPDTVCPPGSVTRLFAFMHRHPGAGAAGPRLVDAEDRPTLSFGFFPRLRDHWLGFLDPRRLWLRGPLARRIVVAPSRSEPSHPVDYVVGACLLMRRHALDRVGPLDERFFLYFEETDWCYRARAAGLEIWFCGEAEVRHLEGAAAGSVSGFSARQFQLSYRLFVAKHYGKWRVVWYRLAQFLEFGGKALLRGLTPGKHNRERARGLWLKARLQLVNHLQPEPPARPGG
ncbi:MAG: glycosyltransferase family 2 protein [Candidatus Krumholzibacteriia bacterium]